MRDMFSLAHAFTARWEGGLAEHPADPGGLTKYGVSMRWVQDLAREAREECLRLRRSCDGCVRPAAGDCAWQALDLDMDGDVDADDVRACTRAQAAALFRRHFWDRLACGRLPLPLAVPLYERFLDQCRQRGFTVEHGEFGAKMDVESLNHGPVTILFDTEKP